jgi:ribosome recycling factor
LILPDLTQERRQELVRMARRRAEEARVSIRNVRRDAQSMIREIQNEGEAGEDDCKRASRSLQDMTDDAVNSVGELLTEKEKQILA